MIVTSAIKPTSLRTSAYDGYETDLAMWLETHSSPAVA